MSRYKEPIQNEYKSRLRSIPAPGGNGCHCALLGVANYGVLVGLTDEQILSDIRHAIPAGKRKVSDREITDTIATARRGYKKGGGCTPRPRHPPPKQPQRQFDADKYMRTLLARSDGASDVDIRRQSPVALKDASGPHDALAVLEGLYVPTEVLFIGGPYDTRINTAAQWIGRIHSAGAVPWPHIIPNPMDGLEHPKKAGGMSFRCDACVCSFRYAVVEFDVTPEYLLTSEQQAAKATWEKTKKTRWPDWPAWPMADQIAFWHSMICIVPVAMICTSGGKSVHAWLRMDCEDRRAWSHDTGTLFDDWLVPLGADGACRNPSRLSRLPGHYRQEKQGWQKLLYLNPNGVTT